MLPRNIKRLIGEDREKAMSLAMEIIAECERQEKPFDEPIRQAKMIARMHLGQLNKERMIAVIEDRNQKQFVHFGPIGDIRTSILFFRTFASDILKYDGVRVYIFHNHPCGTKPSEADNETKDTLIRYLEAFELSLYFFVVTSKTIIQY